MHLVVDGKRLDAFEQREDALYVPAERAATHGAHLLTRSDPR